jgi:nitrite reductase (NADH) small subunit
MSSVSVSVSAWTDVAPVAALTPDRGIAVMVDGRQVAVFLLSDGALHAIDNHDPISQANVLSRGIVGDRGGVPVVASPIFKQCFELATGRCLDDDAHVVEPHLVRVVEGRVHVRLRTSLAAST